MLISFCFEIPPHTHILIRLKHYLLALLEGTAGFSFSNSFCSLTVFKNQSQNEIIFGHYSADCFY